MSTANANTMEKASDATGRSLKHCRQISISTGVKIIYTSQILLVQFVPYEAKL